MHINPSSIEPSKLISIRGKEGIDWTAAADMRILCSCKVGIYRLSLSDRFPLKPCQESNHEYECLNLESMLFHLLL